MDCNQHIQRIIAAKRRGQQRNIEVTFINHASSNANLATYDFGDFTVAEDGLLVALFLARGNNAQTVPSFSIGGVSATIHHSNPNDLDKRAIASKEVTAGDHNVTVALSGNNGNGPGVGVGVYLITGYTSTTPVDADSLNAESTSLALQINTGTNGVSVFGAMTLSILTIESWSEAIESINQQISLIDYAFSYKLTAIAETPDTETVTFDGPSARNLIIGGNWT